MSLAPGSRLGAYDVVSLLGEGGMGQVYRARDTKLNRDVALKILPEAFALDGDRIARFRREAQVLAALNHPHIAQIHGLEEATGTQFLVLELVDGESLDKRIARGPIPVDEALGIARQIAEALEAAHEKGIIHRDLKPANIALTRDGQVKVLDFGLAKAIDNANGASLDAVNSPTITSPAMLSSVGVILGTAAYMSPEQAKGQPADRRSDVWAFGCVLYEMLSGRRAFEGEDVSDTLATVLKGEPQWGALPGNLPVVIWTVLTRCLDKDRKRRIADISTAHFLLAESVADSMPKPTRTHPRALPRRAWAFASMALIGGITVGVVAAQVWLRPRTQDLKPLMRLTVDLGPEAVAGASTTLDISPDGTRIVFPVRGDDGKQRLATRLLDQTQATVLSGTEGAIDPFFSPDGQWVGFFADRKMKKISVRGGAPVNLSDAINPRGASWGEDGTIIAALRTALGIFRVPDSGGTPELLTKRVSGEFTERWPQVLPGRRGVLFTANPGNTQFDRADTEIRVYVFATGESKTLLREAYFPRFLSADNGSGYLLYVHEGTLFAVPFDLSRLELRGKPVPILEDLAADVVNGGGQFTFSATGTLIYLSGRNVREETSVAWVDAAGNSQPLSLPTGGYTTPRISPGGDSLAVSMRSNGKQDIYVYDLQRETMRRLSFASVRATYPAWTPDGTHIAFSSTGASIAWIRANGAEPAQTLIADDPALANRIPYSFSPDGRLLAYYAISAETGSDIWIAPLDLTDPDRPKAGKSEPFIRTQFNEQRGAFSPDGRWMAYESDESGRPQIYVQSFPGPGGKWQISNAGGRYATWARNGKQLFFETLDGYIMVADYVVSGDSFMTGKPRRWSPAQIRDTGSINMTLHPDGQRFVVFPAAENTTSEKGSLRATFLLNFPDELRRRVPIK